MSDQPRLINFSMRPKSGEHLNSRIVAIESFVPLILALHGLVLLLWLGNIQPWQWGVLAGLGGLSLLPILRGYEVPALAYARAAYIFLAGWLLMYSTGGAISLFALWGFVLVAVYPLVLRSRYTPFLPPTVVAGYLLLLPFTAPASLPFALIFSKAFLICFIGWLAYLLGASLQRQTQSYWQTAEQLTKEQSQLRVQMEFNQAVLDSLPAHIAVLNKEGEIIAVNQAWQRFATQNGSQSAAATGVGANYLTVCANATGEFADEASIVAANIRAVMAGQLRHFSLEYPCHSPTEQRWFLLNVAARFGSEGVVVSHTNITKRKATEEALQHSEARNRALLEAIPDAVVRIHQNGTYLDAKAPAAFVPIVAAEQAVGKHVRDLLEPSLAQQFLAVAQQALDNDERQMFEYELKIGEQRRTHEARVVPVGEDEAIFILRDITERKQAEAEQNRLHTEVSQQRAQLRALTARLAKVQEEDHKALARELHDQVGQNLSTLGLQLKILQTQLQTQLPEAGLTQPLLTDTQALVKQITEQVRNVMAELRPPQLDDFGLPAALAWYANRVAKRAGFTVQMAAAEDLPRLPAAVENGLFRITQEAVTNIMKHAQATSVMISLLVHAEQISLTVTDNGRGIAPTVLSGVTQREGWGLLSMRERAEALGGRFLIESQLGEGTHIQVVIAHQPLLKNDT